MAAFRLNPQWILGMSNKLLLCKSWEFCMENHYSESIEHLLPVWVLSAVKEDWWSSSYDLVFTVASVVASPPRPGLPGCRSLRNLFLYLSEWMIVIFHHISRFTRPPRRQNKKSDPADIIIILIIERGLKDAWKRDHLSGSGVPKPRTLLASSRQAGGGTLHWLIGTPACPLAKKCDN